MAYVRQHPDYPKFRKKVGVMPDFSGANKADQENLIGTIDGANRVFTLKNRPIRDSEQLFKDGMFMTRASSLMFEDGDYYLDYLENPVTLTFSEKQVPQANSVIRINYKYMGVGE